MRSLLSRAAVCLAVFLASIGLAEAQTKIYQTSILGRVAIIPLTASDGTEQTSDFSIPTGAIVTDVYINVVTAEATATTKTLDVGTAGTSNDPDGFLDGVATGTAGTIAGTLLSTGQTRGALLRADESGAGVLVPEHNTTAGKTNDAVTYTAGEAQTEFVGEIIIVYLEPALR